MGKNGEKVGSIMNPRTARKIEAAKQLAATLPAQQAQIIRDLCNAHGAMCETNSRLWHDNAAMRRDMATISTMHMLSEVKRIARQHMGGKSRSEQGASQ